MDMFEAADQTVYDRLVEQGHPTEEISDTGTAENLQMFFGLSLADVAGGYFDNTQLDQAIAWI